MGNLRQWGGKGRSEKQAGMNNGDETLGKASSKQKEICTRTDTHVRKQTKDITTEKNKQKCHNRKVTNEEKHKQRKIKKD